VRRRRRGAGSAGRALHDHGRPRRDVVARHGPGGPGTRRTPTADAVHSRVRARSRRDVVTNRCCDVARRRVTSLDAAGCGRRVGGCAASRRAVVAAVRRCRPERCDSRRAPGGPSSEGSDDRYAVQRHVPLDVPVAAAAAMISRRARGRLSGACEAWGARRPARVARRSARRGVRVPSPAPRRCGSSSGGRR
jgi:hypothetical protein